MRSTKSFPIVMYVIAFYDFVTKNGTLDNIFAKTRKGNETKWEMPSSMDIFVSKYDNPISQEIDHFLTLFLQKTFSVSPIILDFVIGHLFNIGGQLTYSSKFVTPSSPFENWSLNHSKQHFKNTDCILNERKQKSNFNRGGRKQGYTSE